jgi:hypothetical protein
VPGVKVSLLLLLPTAALAFHSTPALAATSIKATATASYASATLQAPTGLTATKTCGTSSSVTLKWTATTSAFAASYLLSYTSNGSNGTPRTITGGTTTTVTYAITNGVTYSNLTLAAVYRSWTSLSTPPAASVLC